MFIAVLDSLFCCNWFKEKEDEEEEIEEKERKGIGGKDVKKGATGEDVGG